MKSLPLFLVLLFFAGCNLREEPIVTMDKFYEIPLGTSISQLKEYFGVPVRIHESQSGELIYEYFERFPIAPSKEDKILEVRRYYFIFDKGILKNKFYKIKTEPMRYTYPGGVIE